MKIIYFIDCPDWYTNIYLNSKFERMFICVFVLIGVFSSCDLLWIFSVEGANKLDKGLNSCNVIFHIIRTKELSSANFILSSEEPQILLCNPYFLSPLISISTFLKTSPSYFWGRIRQIYQANPCCSLYLTNIFWKHYLCQAWGFVLEIKW